MVKQMLTNHRFLEILEERDKFLSEILEHILHELREILRLLKPPTAVSISFKEITMNPTEAGQTQVFTGTLSPAGSVLASDAVAKIESNDPAVQPTLDSTQLIVSVTYPGRLDRKRDNPAGVLLHHLQRNHVAGIVGDHHSERTASAASCAGNLGSRSRRRHSFSPNPRRGSSASRPPRAV